MSTKASALTGQHSLTHASNPVRIQKLDGGIFGGLIFFYYYYYSFSLVIEHLKDQQIHSWHLHLLSFKTCKGFLLLPDTFIQQLKRCRFCTTFLPEGNSYIAYIVHFLQENFKLLTTDYSRLEAHLSHSFVEAVFLSIK